MDPYLVLREVPRGFRGASLQVEFREEKIRLSDEHFDLEASHDQPPQTLDAAGIKAFQLARLIRNLDGPELSSVKWQAAQGSKRAERVYHAIVLGQLCTMRAAARDLIARARSGDAEAKERAELILLFALRCDNPLVRFRASILAHLLRDALFDSQALPNESDEPAVEPNNGPKPQAEQESPDAPDDPHAEEDTPTTQRTPTIPSEIPPGDPDVASAYRDAGSMVH